MTGTVGFCDSRSDHPLCICLGEGLDGHSPEFSEYCAYVDSNCGAHVLILGSDIVIQLLLKYVFLPGTLQGALIVLKFTV